MIRFGKMGCVAALALVASFLVIGCDQQLAVDQQNISGAWESNFNDLAVTLVFRPDGSYAMPVRARTGTNAAGGGGLLMLSGWSRYQNGSSWRLEDDEIIVSDWEGRTVPGLPMVVKQLTADTLVLQLGEKAPIRFTRTNIPAAPTFAAGFFAAGDDEEDDLDDLDE